MKEASVPVPASQNKVTKECGISSSVIKTSYYTKVTHSLLLMQ